MTHSIIRTVVTLQLLLTIGCTTTVDLRVKNGTSSPISSTVIVKDENGARSRSDLSLGVIGVNQETSITFEAKPNSTFEVVGSTNAKVASSGIVTILKKPNPFTKSVVLTSQAKTIDDTTSLNEISNSFKKLGADIGAYPLPLNSALKTVIGSLVVAERGEENKPGKIYLTIPPNILGVKELTLEDIPRIPTEEISQTEISGAAASQASVQYATLGGFNAGFKSSGIYQLKWFLSGFGSMQKAEDLERNPAKMFRLLDKDYITQIKSTLKKNPKSKIFYINNFYVLDRARLTVKEAQLASGDTELDSVVLSAGSAFTFENSQEQHKSYGPVVLNYWGSEFDLIEISNPLKNVTTISGEPSTSTEDTPLLVPTVDSAAPVGTFKKVDDSDENPSSSDSKQLQIDTDTTVMLKGAPKTESITEATTTQAINTLVTPFNGS